MVTTAECIFFLSAHETSMKQDYMLYHNMSQQKLKCLKSYIACSDHNGIKLEINNINRSGICQYL